MPPSDEFLHEYYEDCREEMRGRRELDFRLVEILLFFCPLFVAGMTALYSTDLDQRVYLALSVGASVFMLLLSGIITHRIIVEHNAYANMGRTVQKIWEYFGLFDPGAYLPEDSILPDILRDPRKGFGRGLGHIRTLWLVWLVTGTIIAVIVALGIFRNPA